MPSQSHKLLGDQARNSIGHRRRRGISVAHDGCGRLGRDPPCEDGQPGSKRCSGSAAAHSSSQGLHAGSDARKCRRRPAVSRLKRSSKRVATC